MLRSFYQREMENLLVLHFFQNSVLMIYVFVFGNETGTNFILSYIHVLLFSEEKDKSQLASGDALVEELDNSLFDKEYQLDTQVLKTEVGIFI